MKQPISPIPQSQNGGKSSGLRSPSDIEPLKDQIRELYGRTTYSQKTHIIQAGMEIKRRRTTKWIEIVLSAITTTSLATTLLGYERWGIAVSSVASTILLAVILHTKDFDLGQVAEQHKRTADELWRVRELFLCLLTDIEAGVIAPEAIVKKRDALIEQLDAIYSAQLVTSPDAYAKAQDALKNKEDMTFSDLEIDLLLPSTLRKTTSAKDVTHGEDLV